VSTVSSLVSAHVQAGAQRDAVATDGVEHMTVEEIIDYALESQAL